MRVIPSPGVPGYKGLIEISGSISYPSSEAIRENYDIVEFMLYAHKSSELHDSTRVFLDELPDMLKPSCLNVIEDISHYIPGARGEREERKTTYWVTDHSNFVIRPFKEIPMNSLFTSVKGSVFISNNVDRLREWESLPGTMSIYMKSWSRYVQDFVQKNGVGKVSKQDVYNYLIKIIVSFRDNLDTQLEIEKHLKTRIFKETL